MKPVRSRVARTAFALALISGCALPTIVMAESAIVGPMPLDQYTIAPSWSPPPIAIVPAPSPVASIMPEPSPVASITPEPSPDMCGGYDGDPDLMDTVCLGDAGLDGGSAD